MPRSLVSTDLTIRSLYSQGAGIYRRIPAAVARPRDGAELAHAIGYARDEGMPVVPRGAGSGMPGDNIGHGLVLDLTAFDAGRLIVDADRREVRCAPSVTLGAINSAAENHGLRLAVDPSSSAWATAAGVVSTNAAGPHSVRSGSMRRWVRAVALSTADGPLRLDREGAPDDDHEIIRRWQHIVEPLIRQHRASIESRYPRVRKNSAGYGLDHYLESGSLVDIVVGSEGTLGVITEVVFRLEPIPTYRTSMQVRIRERSELTAVIELVRSHDPATLEFLDASFLRVVAQDRAASIDAADVSAAGLLLVDFEGGRSDAVRSPAEAVAAELAGSAVTTRIAADSESIESLWNIRHAASPMLARLGANRRSLQVIEDGCVPIRRLSEYLGAIDDAVADARVEAVMFGHAGDGHVHVNLLPDLHDVDWKPRVRSAFDAVSTAVIELGGTPSGEHGVGTLRAGLLPKMYGPEVMACFAAVKRAFDPDGTFNPGVIIGDGSDPLGELKVGIDRVPLPEGIEEKLEQVERTAAWGGGGGGAPGDRRQVRGDR